MLEQDEALVDHVTTPPPTRPRRTFDDPRAGTPPSLETATEASFKATAMSKIGQAKFDPYAGMALLREFFWAHEKIRQAKQDVKPLCVVVRHAGSLFPQARLASMDQEDRRRLVFFLNLISESTFRLGSGMFVLLSPMLTDIHEKIRGLSGVEAVDVAFPKPDERAAYVTHFMGQHPQHEFGLSNTMVVEHTPGLQLSVLSDLLSSSVRMKGLLTVEALKGAVNKRLEVLLGEFATVENLSHVPLPENLRCDPALKDVCDEIFSDTEDPETCPFIVQFVGPNGGGKTYIAMSYLRGTGRIVIKLSKIRTSEYGGTEQLLERFRLIVESFGNIGVLIDESDLFFGKPGDAHDHKVDQRITGEIQAMTSDERFRYRVLFVMATARPKNQSPDMLSRCTGTTIAVFDLEGDRRKAFLASFLQERGIAVEEAELEAVFTQTEGFSNRDLVTLVTKYRSKKKKRTETTLLTLIASEGLNDG
jgi:hypothetical protein